MTKHKFLALAAGLVIAAGTLGLSAGGAAAQPYYGGPGYPGGPGYHGWHGGPQGPGWGYGPGRYCKPVYRTVKVRGYHGWHFEQVVVGKRCFGPPRPRW